jgi:hypothetical protein
MQCSAAIRRRAYARACVSYERNSCNTAASLQLVRTENVSSCIKKATNITTHLHSYGWRISFELIQLRTSSSTAAASIAQHFMQHWQPVLVEGCSTSQIPAAL